MTTAISLISLAAIIAGAFGITATRRRMRKLREIQRQMEFWGPLTLMLIREAAELQEAGRTAEAFVKWNAYLSAQKRYDIEVTKPLRELNVI